MKIYVVNGCAGSYSWDVRGFYTKMKAENFKILVQLSADNAIALCQYKADFAYATNPLDPKMRTDFDRVTYFVDELEIEE